MTMATPALNIRVAVLLTCHNRRETTLAALRQLFAQDLPADVGLIAFLVDDGSTDGTGSAVTESFPQVRVLPGDGSLFWSGGMRWAYDEALAEGFEYYFWLNDDTLLRPDALRTLLATCDLLTARGLSRLIVVGSTDDPDTGETTYGGVVRTTRLHPLKFRLLEPASCPQPCATMNGNVVLVSRSAAETVGNISPDFSHSMGDFDYGLCARKLGCAIWAAPGYAGSCRRNGVKNTWKDSSLRLRESIRRLTSVKGLPMGPYRHFAKAHGGPLWPLFWLMPYMHAVVSLLVKRIARSPPPLPALPVWRQARRRRKARHRIEKPVPGIADRRGLDAPVRASQSRSGIRPACHGRRRQTPYSLGWPQHTHPGAIHGSLLRQAGRTSDDWRWRSVRHSHRQHSRFTRLGESRWSAMAPSSPAGATPSVAAIPHQ
jgi:GT2 family glycosyltransferase